MLARHAGELAVAHEGLGLDVIDLRALHVGADRAPGRDVRHEPLHLVETGVGSPQQVRGAKLVVRLLRLRSCLGQPRATDARLEQRLRAAKRAVPAHLLELKVHLPHARRERILRGGHQLWRKGDRAGITGLLDFGFRLVLPGDGCLGTAGGRQHEEDHCRHRREALEKGASRGGVVWGDQICHSGERGSQPARHSTCSSIPAQSNRECTPRAAGSQTPTARAEWSVTVYFLPFFFIAAFSAASVSFVAMSEAD